mmetsp:Transcript_3302/g.10098  ORF Transcript_3302/g.10098 Transcript_3302/m.10098 type:complete len:288 (+) Transcript_3302:366-1229(+)
MERRRLAIKDLVNEEGAKEEDIEAEGAVEGDASQSIERRNLRREWNLQHSRRSRQRVAKAVEQLMAACGEVMHTTTQPQAEIMLTAAKIVRTLRRENTVLKARLELTSDASRTQVVSNIADKAGSPVEALTELLQRIVYAWDCAMAECWCSSEKSGTHRLTSVTNDQFDSQSNVVKFDAACRREQQANRGTFPERLVSSQEDQKTDCTAMDFGRKELFTEFEPDLKTAIGIAIPLRGAVIGAIFFFERGRTEDSDFLPLVKLTLQSMRQAWETSSTDLTSLLLLTRP